jgi:hypothetical protein
VRSSHLRPVQNTSAPQSEVKPWNRGSAKVLRLQFSAKARRRDYPRDKHFNRAGPISCGAYGAITGLASASCRAAAGHRSRAGNLCGAGASVAVGGRTPPRPIGGTGGTAAHAEGPLVMAGCRGRLQVTSAAPSDGRGACAAPHATPTSRPAPEYGLDQRQNQSHPPYRVVRSPNALRSAAALNTRCGRTGGVR